jgi:hypothetical protein
MSDEFIEDDDWEYPAPEGSAEEAPETPVEAEMPEAAAPASEPPRKVEPGPELPRQPDEWMRAIEAVLMAATEPVEP